MSLKIFGAKGLAEWNFTTWCVARGGC